MINLANSNRKLIMTSQITKTKSKQIQLVSRPDGTPTKANFESVEIELPELEQGQILVRNQWLSVDPYMRGRMRAGKSYTKPFDLNAQLEGGCVGEVVQSRNDNFAVGDMVLGNQGWREYWLSDGTDATKIDTSSVAPQSYLSVLGMTGMTAFVGLLKIAELKENEKVFVSAASGAVGSIVCQIAKAKNCFVVGSAGSADKIEWLKNKAGVDEAFNYKDTDDISARLGELCPDGIDVYFDNVGGDHLQAAIDCMNNKGRITCCGMISSYNDSEPKPGPNNLIKLIGKRIKMQGFIVRDHFNLQNEFLQQMTQWISADQIVWEETVTEGLENAPQAFIDLFDGDKMGKALVKLEQFHSRNLIAGSIIPF